MGKSSQKTTTKPQWSPYQLEMQKLLLGTAQPYLTAEPDIFSQLQQPYTGQFTAPLSEYEQRALNILGGYQPGTSTQLSSDVLQKTLQGGYLPEAIGGYYEPYKRQVMREAENAQTQLRQSANLGGMLASTPRIGQEADLQAQINDLLSGRLSDIYQAERQRQLQAIPQALGLERFPLEYAQTLLGAGALPRQIEQAGLASKYQDWLRQLQALGMPLDVAMKLATLAPGTQTTSSTSEGALGILGDILQLGLMGSMIFG